ncbi:amino acid permease [Candidatus Woesearchaeota archaeon]|nr:amino acid permease [Candidatus Woesearchaeota archaeon]
MNHTLGAAAIIIGTTIGAGILGLPKAIESTGYIAGLLILIIVALLTLLTNLAIGETALRVRDDHQLPGLAKKFLGDTGKRIVSLAMMFSIYGAMTAYLIGIPTTIKELVGGDIYVYAIIIWIIISILVLKGIKTVAGTELGLGIGLILIIGLISILAAPYISLENYSIINTHHLFIAYGVALFAYMGMVAVPEAREALRGREDKLAKAIVIGLIVPFIIYVLFSTVVVGVTGNETTEIATIGLGRKLGIGFSIFGNIFAIMAMLTSFIALSNAGLEMYRYDYKQGKIKSLLFTMLPPLLLYFILGGRGFERVISITGAITGAILGITVMHMYYKSQSHSERKPEYMIKLPRIGIILIDLLFLAGLLSILL